LSDALPSVRFDGLHRGEGLLLRFSFHHWLRPTLR
jgi:hypothetical protein